MQGEGEKGADVTAPAVVSSRLLGGEGPATTTPAVSAEAVPDASGPAGGVEDDGPVNCLDAAVGPSDEAPDGDSAGAVTAFVEGAAAVGDAVAVVEGVEAVAHGEALAAGSSCGMEKGAAHPVVASSGPLDDTVRLVVKGQVDAHRRVTEVALLSATEDELQGRHDIVWVVRHRGAFM